MKIRIEWHTEKRNIKDLRPYDKNPRIIDEAGLKQLSESFDEIGYAQYININTDNTILSGHARYYQLKNENVKEVDVLVPNRKLTSKEEEAVVIRMNKIHAGDWDFKKLDLDWDRDDILNWGFDESELLEVEIEKIPGCDEDEFPEVKGDPITKRGDVWLMGNHRVMCGDSTMIDNVEKLMNSEKSEILFTSPPYSNMRDYNGEKDLSVNNLVEFITAYSHVSKYQVINLGIQRKNNEIYDYWSPYIEKAKENGYLFLSWNVWNKGESGSIGAQTAMFPLEHEWIFVFGKKRKDLNKTVDCKWANSKSTANSRRNKDGTLSKVSNYIVGDKKPMGSVYNISPLKARNLDNTHPAAFTVEFSTGYIEAMTDIKDSVIDPFCGSGTTLIACEKTNRKCYGMELDEHYCDVIINRWQQYTGESATLESTDWTYEEIKNRQT